MKVFLPNSVRDEAGLGPLKPAYSFLSFIELASNLQ